MSDKKKTTGGLHADFIIIDDPLIHLDLDGGTACPPLALGPAWHNYLPVPMPLNRSSFPTLISCGTADPRERLKNKKPGSHLASTECEECDA